MNTYYELVTYLNSIINVEELDDEIINNFKNYTLYLQLLLYAGSFMMSNTCFFTLMYSF